MDIFLFNDVPRFRHNESGFSQISIFCGCVKSHGRVWKNESHGVISMVFVGRKPSCWKRQLYAFSSALPTSLFQPLLRQRSPRHLYMSLWQFLTIYYNHLQRSMHITWSPSSISDMMLNKMLYIITQETWTLLHPPTPPHLTPPHPTPPTVASTSPQRSIKVWST